MDYTEIVWKEIYSIGVKEIDDQHKKLLQIANTFLKARLEEKETEVLKETFVNLIDYTKYHFETEEKHMEKNKYDGLTEQKRQHQMLIKQIVQVLNHLKAGETYAVDELENLLKNWLVKHILDHDKKYGDFLAG